MSFYFLFFFCIKFHEKESMGFFGKIGIYFLKLLRGKQSDGSQNYGNKSDKFYLSAKKNFTE